MSESSTPDTRIDDDHLVTEEVTVGDPAAPKPYMMEFLSPAMRRRWRARAESGEEAASALVELLPDDVKNLPLHLSR